MSAPNESDSSSDDWDYRDQVLSFRALRPKKKTTHDMYTQTSPISSKNVHTCTSPTNHIGKNVSTNTEHVEITYKRKKLGSKMKLSKNHNDMAFIKEVVKSMYCPHDGCDGGPYQPINLQHHIEHCPKAPIQAKFKEDDDSKYKDSIHHSPIVDGSQDFDNSRSQSSGSTYSPSTTQDSFSTIASQDMQDTQSEHEDTFVLMSQKRHHTKFTSTLGVSYKRSFDEEEEYERKDSDTNSEANESESEMQITQGDVDFIDDTSPSKSQSPIKKCKSKSLEHSEDSSKPLEDSSEECLDLDF